MSLSGLKGFGKSLKGAKFVNTRTCTLRKCYWSTEKTKCARAPTLLQLQLRHHGGAPFISHLHLTKSLPSQYLP